MTIGIIVPNLPNYAPYTKSYTDLFDDLNIKYTFICWNRNNDNLNDYKNLVVYNKTSYESDSLIKKIYGYFMFSIFVKNHLKHNKYKFLTIHTIACVLFLKSILKNQKYFLDIRDYSPMIIYFKKRLSFLIDKSLVTTISSNGYKKWLPSKHNYILSHNIRKSDLNILRPKPTLRSSKSKIEVLTIGQIRDFSANSHIIQSLGNSKFFNLNFIGSGTELENLKKFSNSFNNVEFYGRYMKKDEPTLVMNSDIINIFLPNSFHTMTQMTNRFYLCLIYRKPMIVNLESIQAYYVKKFSLGITIDSSDDINSKLNSFIENFNSEEFDKACDLVLKIIQKDISSSEIKIEKIINRLHSN